MLNVRDFIRLKGSYVYEVHPYNFHMTGNDISDLKSGDIPVIAITKVKVISAGQKVVNFENYKGVSKMSVNHYKEKEHINWFDNEMDATEYAKYNFAKHGKIVYRNAFLSDYEAYRNDTPIYIFF